MITIHFHHFLWPHDLVPLMQNVGPQNYLSFLCRESRICQGFPQQRTHRCQGSPPQRTLGYHFIKGPLCRDSRAIIASKVSSRKVSELSLYQRSPPQMSQSYHCIKGPLHKGLRAIIVPKVPSTKVSELLLYQRSPPQRSQRTQGYHCIKYQVKYLFILFK